jgi:Xaa-Pro aminopeptidase
MNFSNLSDERFLSDLKEVRNQEREILLKVLRYLRETEERKLYAKRGYTSMHAFCMEELGYSEDETHPRLQAMRLIKTNPEVEAHIDAGEITLTVLAKAQSYFKHEERSKRPLDVEQKG